MFNPDKFIIILSGPSGVGKTTMCNKFLEQYKTFTTPISVTTRPPRDYEINGKHYNFITSEQYEEMQAKGQLLEAVTIYGNKYGTQSLLVETQLKHHDLIFSIDVSGMCKIREFFKDKVNVITIFILPPSIEALKQRIQKRGDEQKNVEERMAKAFSEIQGAKEYDYIIINDDLEAADKQFFAIFETAKISSKRETLLKMFSQQ